MSKKFLIRGTTLALLCQGYADEELAYAQETSSNRQTTDETVCTSPYRNWRAGVRHKEAHGIGYKDGYSTLEVFGLSDHCGTHFLPFFDLRGHVFNNGRLAGNAGIGARSLLSNYFLGGYVYYDVRSDSRLTVHQVSPGIELLGKRMEYRVNGYFPVGKKHSSYYHPEFHKFKGHQLYIERTQKRALSGADAEVGVHLTQQTKYDVYAGIGPYYLYDAPSSAWGGKARVAGSYKQFLTLEVSGSHDRLFKTILQGSVAINIPFGHKKLKHTGNHCSSLLLTRAVESPARLEIPMIRKYTKSEVAINPGTGEPWQFWFVDNLSSSLGTYESPFPMLAQAQNASSSGDIIYVFPGDGTTLGMNAGITLKDNQKLFGSGVKQTLATPLGNISIPAQSKAMPLITNTTPNVVTLANNNEVSGVHLTSGVAASLLIFGNPVNTSIHNNTLTSTASSGSFPAGICLAGSGNFFIANNHIQGTAAAGLSLGIDIHGPINAQSTVTIIENTVLGFDTAIFNTIARDGTCTVDIGNNYLTSNDTKACLVTFDPLLDPGGTLRGRIHDNICDNRKANPGTFGIYLDATNGLNGCLTVENNQVFGTATNGLFTRTAGGGSFSIIATDNILSDSGPALFQTIEAGTTLCVRLLDNQSPTGYLVTNTAGTLNLEPPVGNTGTVTTVGVTSVPANTCCP